jgi:molecular chaperone GrpE
MAHDRNQYGPAVAPGEPEAPAGVRPSAPAPGAGAPGAGVPEPGHEPAPANGGAQGPASTGAQEPAERDVEELAALAAKAQDYLALAQRTQADFENYRKRALRDAAAAQERGIAKLARELLPAVDNLDRALTAAQAPGPVGGDADQLVAGIKLVHDDVVAALARVGIEPFSPQGEPFDPTFHEAIAQHPTEGAAPGMIVEVYQRGYRIGESVLRPARVVVSG